MSVVGMSQIRDHGRLLPGEVTRLAGIGDGIEEGCPGLVDHELSPSAQHREGIRAIRPEVLGIDLDLPDERALFAGLAVLVQQHGGERPSVE